MYIPPPRHEPVQKTHKCSPSFYVSAPDAVRWVFPATSSFAIIPTSETVEEEFSINSVMELPPSFGYVGIFGKFSCPSYV
jgi:hypothetical protein